MIYRYAIMCLLVMIYPRWIHDYTIQVRISLQSGTRGYNSTTLARRRTADYSW